ncbi:MAG: vanadium-dependent haloperoxidase [Nocardioidaceae bacterium]|nr:vanadium-dependent haloperoxidase [Nocardioidaceae bacterium]
MTPRSRARSALLLVAGAVTAALVTLPSRAPAVTPPAGHLLGWYDATASVVAIFASPVQAPSSAIWATAWSAADRAVSRPGPADGPYAVAAAAQALRDVLVQRVPAATAALDARLAETLATVPDTGPRARAIDAGKKAAAAVLAERASDGLSVAAVNTPYTPTAGPGFWVTTTAGKPAIQASLGHATPFLLGTGDRFAVGAPPALGTPAYRSDLDEVRTYGAKTGSLRTDAQTQVALFWGQSSLNAYTQVLRAALTQLQAEGASVRRQVHLVALFHQVTTDAQIAVYANKYVYEHWRPLTAIREADLAGNPISDGDPLTTPAPAWEPLIATPLHPEYPSGHTGYAGAAEAVLTALVGTPAPFTVTSTVAGASPRTYTDWATLTSENIDARVWEGVHFRTSDTIGASLGRTVAAYDLAAAG